MRPDIIQISFVSIILSLTATIHGIASPLRVQQVVDFTDAISKLQIGSHVPGTSPATYCSDPETAIFKITRLDFYPTNPQVFAPHGYSEYLTVQFVGRFSEPTGDFPWLHITGVINGRPELGPMYDSPLCDINVFQDIKVPGDDGSPGLSMHRSCRPGIKKGYTWVNSPPMRLSPEYGFVPGNYSIRAHAYTQDGRSIFCVEGSLIM